ncbi:MAG: hypothetical protein JWO17_536 [Actinomycetia bacterium]|nr:hypothetical protein [Actinomycetes bacterium]
MLPSKRSVAAVTAVLSALALAAPIAGAGATTTPGPYAGFSLPALFSLSVPGFAAPLSLDIPSVPAVVIPSIPGATVSKGPTVVDSVFNGATVVQVDNGTALNSVIGSP